MVTPTALENESLLVAVPNGCKPDNRAKSARDVLIQLKAADCEGL